MEMLNVMKPDYQPKATEFVEKMISAISKLEEKNLLIMQKETLCLTYLNLIFMALYQVEKEKNRLQEKSKSSKL